MTPPRTQCSCTQLINVAQKQCHQYASGVLSLTEKLSHYCPGTCGLAQPPPSPSPPPIEDLASMMSEYLSNHGAGTEWLLARKFPEYHHVDNMAYDGADLHFLRMFPWGPKNSFGVNTIDCDHLQPMPVGSYFEGLCDDVSSSAILDITRLCWDEVGFTTSIQADMGRYYYLSGGNTGADPRYLLDGVYPDDGAEDLKTCFVTQSVPNAHWTLKFTSKRYWVDSISLYGRAGAKSVCDGANDVSAGCGQSRNLTVALITNRQTGVLADADCRKWFMYNPTHPPVSAKCKSAGDGQYLVDVSRVNEWCWAYSSMVPHKLVFQIAFDKMEDSQLEAAGYAILKAIVAPPPEPGSPPVPRPVFLQVITSGGAGTHYADSGGAAYAIYVTQQFAHQKAGMLSLSSSVLMTCEEIQGELSAGQAALAECEPTQKYALLSRVALSDLECLYECAVKGYGFSLQPGAPILQALHSQQPCTVVGSQSQKMSLVNGADMHSAWEQSQSMDLFQGHIFGAGGLLDSKGRLWAEVTQCWTKDELNTPHGIEGLDTGMELKYKVFRAIEGGCSLYILGKLVSFAHESDNMVIEHKEMLNAIPTLQKMLRSGTLNQILKGQKPNNGLDSVRHVAAALGLVSSSTFAGVTTEFQANFDVHLQDHYLYAYGSRVWKFYNYSASDCVAMSPPPEPIPPSPPSPSPPVVSPPPPPMSPTPDRSTRRKLSSECTVATPKGDWAAGQNAICVDADDVMDYCAVVGRCVRPSQPDSVDDLPTCKDVRGHTYLCGTQINAEFHHTGNTRATVSCEGKLARAIAVINANQVGLGLCEVQIVGRERAGGVPIVLAGKKKIFAKYSPHGFQGFLHFLYDCLLRVWWKSKLRWGGNQLYLPGENSKYVLPRRPLYMQLRAA